MNRQLTLKADDLNDEAGRRAVLEEERRQEREETLRWISVSALTKFRHAWRQ